jgi:hypothetical protein
MLNDCSILPQPSRGRPSEGDRVHESKDVILLQNIMRCALCGDFLNKPLRETYDCHKPHIVGSPGMHAVSGMKYN